MRCTISGKIALFLSLGILVLNSKLSYSFSISESEQEIQEWVNEVSEDLITKLPRNFDEQGVFFSEIRLAELTENFNLDKVCSGNEKLAKWNANDSIVLSKQLVQWALNAEASSRELHCSHKSPRKIVQGTIVHLLAHRYDQFFNLSDSPKFKNLLGGQKSKLNWRGDKISNANRNRSPNPNEFRNLKEAFATNFEFFVLDENYQCLKPAHSSFYSNYFKRQEKTPRATQESDCTDYKQVLVQSKHQQDHLLRAVNLSADRVYQVHYLHAAEGPSFSSRWGHSMFRLILCAPDRQIVGPECLNDVSEDIVLSYRAKVSDLSVNHWSGISGKYPSQLFAFSFAEVLREYTRMEFRDLKSIPLNLNQTEKEEFLNLALERYWNYTGQYFFFTNHCASEALRHLRTVSPSKFKTHKARTPRSLFSSIEASQWLADSSSISPFISKESSALYFPSKENAYKKAFAYLKKRTAFNYSSLDEFIEETDDSNRMFIYNALIGESELQREKRRLLTNLLFLERLRVEHAIGQDLDSNLPEQIQRNAWVENSDFKELRLLIAADQNSVESETYGIPSRAAQVKFMEDRIERLLEFSKKLDSKKKSNELKVIFDRIGIVSYYEDYLLDQISKIKANDA